MRLYGIEVEVPMMLGTAQYPSPAIMAEAFRASSAGVATVSLRRESGAGSASREFWKLVSGLGVRVLPNTAGCHTVKEAVTTAAMAREIFSTDWIKLEVIGNPDTLQPDVYGLAEAAKLLCEEGFKVFPYTTEDLVVAERLLSVGCEVLMPWAAPIGTGLGLTNEYGLRTLRARLPDVTMIIDAGLGVPSQAARVMELGFDGILLNTAVAKSGDPVAMATAFAKATEAGNLARLAVPMEPRDMAAASTPEVGKAFLE